MDYIDIDTTSSPVSSFLEDSSPIMNCKLACKKRVWYMGELSLMCAIIPMSSNRVTILVHLDMAKHLAFTFIQVNPPFIQTRMIDVFLLMVTYRAKLVY